MCEYTNCELLTYKATHIHQRGKVLLSSATAHLVFGEDFVLSDDIVFIIVCSVISLYQHSLRRTSALVLF